MTEIIVKLWKYNIFIKELYVALLKIYSAILDIMRMNNAELVE